MPTMEFYKLLNYGTSTDISFANENNITNWNDYKNYLQILDIQNANNESSSNGDNSNGSISDSILDIKSYLDEKHSEYNWIRNEEECALTSDVSNNIPIEMQSSAFPRSDINEAIVVAGVENETSYGGCDPIAAMGIMDYFARYLGYNQIIDNPTDSNNRIILATEILSHTLFLFLAALIILLFGLGIIAIASIQSFLITIYLTLFMQTISGLYLAEKRIIIGIKLWKILMKDYRLLCLQD